MSGQGHPVYMELLDTMKGLHLLKSGGYGTHDDPFANYTAVARANGGQERFKYAMDRVQEKLARAYSLYQQDRFGELEEEFMDIASGMVCATAMLREDK